MVVDIPDGYHVRVASTYLATTDLDECKQGRWDDDGNYRLVPIRIFDVEANQTVHNHFVMSGQRPGSDFKESGNCEFKRLNSHLSVYTSREPSYNVVDVITGDGDTSGDVQAVTCWKANLGDHGSQIACVGDVVLNPSGSALVKVEIE